MGNKEYCTVVCTVVPSKRPTGFPCYPGGDFPHSGWLILRFGLPLIDFSVGRLVVVSEISAFPTVEASVDGLGVDRLVVMKRVEARPLKPQMITLQQPIPSFKPVGPFCWLPVREKGADLFNCPADL